MLISEKRGIKQQAKVKTAQTHEKTKKGVYEMTKMHQLKNKATLREGEKSRTDKTLKKQSRGKKLRVSFNKYI